MTEHPVDTTRIRQATAVAREYDALQGLTYVALGGGFLFAAATGQPAIWIALGAAFGALAAGWYHRRYGFVRPRPDRASRLLVGSVVAILLILAGYVLDQWLRPPVSFSLLAIVVVLGGGQWLMLRRVGLTPVHWIVYALLVVAAFGPIVGWGVGGLFTPYVLVVTGLALLVVGVVDHLRLVRLLGPLPEETGR